MIQKIQTPQKILSTSEIAAILHVKRITPYRWIKTGKLKASNLPRGRYRVLWPDFITFLKNNHMLNFVNTTEISDNKTGNETRILIVDNEINVVEMIKKHLERANPNFRISTANNGFQAGSLLYSFKPDIVILDLIMPGIDGFTVCRHIKSDPVTKNIQIIAITGYASKENIERIKKEGAAACIVKPFECNEVLIAIDKLTRRVYEKSMLSRYITASSVT